MPGIRLWNRDLDPVIGEHRDRHVNVWLARDRCAGMADREALFEASAGEQKRRDELAGTGGVDRHLAARDLACSADGEWQGVTPFDDDPE